MSVHTLPASKYWQMLLALTILCLQSALAQLPRLNVDLHYNSESSTSLLAALADSSQNANHRSDPHSKEQLTIVRADCRLELVLASTNLLQVSIHSALIGYAVDGVQRHDDELRIASELPGTYLLHLDSGRALERIEYPARLSSDTRSLCEALMCTLQGDLKLEQSPASFSVRTLHDRLGEFRSHDRLSKSSTGWQRRSLRRGYLLGSSDDPSVQAYIRQQNSMSGQAIDSFTVQRALRARSGSDSQVVRFASRPIIRSVSNYSLHFKPSRSASRSDVGQNDSLVSASLPEELSSETTHRAAMEQLMAHHTPSGLLDTLRRLPQLDSSIARSIEPPLRAAAYLHESFCDSLDKVLTALDIEDQRLLLIQHVLTRSHQVNVSHIVARLLERLRSTPAQLCLILPDCDEIWEPGADLIEVLQRFAFNDTSSFVRSTAQLCLAGMVRASRAHAPQISKKVYNSLLDHSSEMSTTQWLLVLGNAAEVLSIDTLISYINKQDTLIAALALRSLRFIPGVEADSLLALALLDRSTTLPEAALFALQYRQPGRPLTIALVQHHVRSAIEDQRNQSKNLLRRWMNDMPCVDESACVQYWIQQCSGSPDWNEEQKRCVESLLQ